jgi:hypothetical protein
VSILGSTRHEMIFTYAILPESIQLFLQTAMLIVGYGEEVSRGTLVKYWIGKLCPLSMSRTTYQSCTNLPVTETVLHAPLLILISLSDEARNSWGSGWGENGYVRVARLGGSKGHHGVCGIAHSPSVALGGMFTRDVEIEKFGDYMSAGRFYHDGSEPDRSLMARASYQIQSAMQ